MALPEVIRVKLSTEAAESISLTPVVVQEMPVRELVEYLLGVTGKDAARIRDLLLRGTMVSGASRFRWAGLEADEPSIRALLGTFPDPDPARPFAAAHCVRVLLLGGRSAIPIMREAASRKAFFRRTSFWDVLLGIVSAAGPVYSGYSYRDRVDCYRTTISLDAARNLRASARLLRYSRLEEQVRSAGIQSAELFVIRA